MRDDHAHVMQVKLCKANTRGVTVRHDRHCAQSSRCWVLNLPPIDASCCRERIRALSIAGDLTVSEFAPVSTVVIVVNVRGGR